MRRETKITILLIGAMWVAVAVAVVVLLRYC